MSNATPKYVPPSISETAFNCPHCGALAKQDWFNLRATQIEKDGVPQRISAEQLAENPFAKIEDEDQRKRLSEWAARMAAGAPFIQVRYIKDGICIMRTFRVALTAMT